jgi:hypothetical protein
VLQQTAGFILDFQAPWTGRASSCVSPLLSFFVRRERKRGWQAHRYPTSNRTKIGWP